MAGQRSQMCVCDDGEVTFCTRRCVHCEGCLNCPLNGAGKHCNCMKLKPDCNHRAFSRQYPECPCDDGELTFCTRRCGHCEGCLNCPLNGAGKHCNCMKLKPDCNHRAFSRQYPECPCDDGELTFCTRRCGHCEGCLNCPLNGAGKHCNCMKLKPDCNHRAFSRQYPECPCDDGELTFCTRRCGHCEGCLKCPLNGAGKHCNCIKLKPDCNHRAFSRQYPDCRCDDGELTFCTRRCVHCEGCLKCPLNGAGKHCNCMKLKPDCNHRAFSRQYPDCRCDDGELTFCTRRCGHCEGCLKCPLNGAGKHCNCMKLKPDCNHRAFSRQYPECSCDDGELTFCTRRCGHCGRCLSCPLNVGGKHCNCIKLKPDCNHHKTDWPIS